MSLKDLFTRKGSKKAESSRLVEFSYSPGYSDMCGECHHSELRKNENGEWQIETRDRLENGEPTVKAVYAVSAEAAERFEAFIREKKILSLEKRFDSNVFVTDYSPWNYSIIYGKMTNGRLQKEMHSIRQYKRYSKRDRALISEMNERFLALYGEKISEVRETKE